MPSMMPTTWARHFYYAIQHTQHDLVYRSYCVPVDLLHELVGRRHRTIQLRAELPGCWRVAAMGWCLFRARIERRICCRRYDDVCRDKTICSS